MKHKIWPYTDTTIVPRMQTSSPVSSEQTRKNQKLEKMAQNYDFMRLLRGLADHNPSMAANEIELGYEINDPQYHRGISRPVVPFGFFTRDLTKGSATAGGNLIGTTHTPAAFIEGLRNRMYCVSAGAQVMGGLIGDVAIPKQTKESTAYWLTEGSELPAEGAPTFDKVMLSPKTVGAYIDVSRKMILQSEPMIEQIIRKDLFDGLSLALDRAALVGSSSVDEPLGILSAVGTQELPISGAALAWVDVIAMETAVTSVISDETRCCYITNPAVAGLLKSLHTNATYGETPLWTRAGDNSMLNGYVAYATNQIPKADDESILIFGDFSQMMLGIWGQGIELVVDTSTLAKSGGLRICAFLDCDVALRHPEAFAWIPGIDVS